MSRETDLLHMSTEITEDTGYQIYSNKQLKFVTQPWGIALMDNSNNSSNITNGFIKDEDKPYYDFYLNAQFTTGFICFPLMCFPGIIGNIFILVVFAQKSMLTSTNVYLSSLAASDIIKLINDVLYFLTVLLAHTSPVHGNRAYGYLYPYAHFIFNMSVCVSSWLTVSVAVERYILVCHPARAKGIISIPRAKSISIAIFIIMTSVAIPSALRYKTVMVTELENGKNVTKLDVELTQLWKNEGFVTSYTWLQSLLRSIIPLFILIFMNAFIINALRKTRANKKNASRNKITIMLIIVIIFFLFCIIPDAVMSAFFNFGYTESENFLVKGVREITDMLLAVNAAINFFLYIIFNKIFRDQFKELFCSSCCKTKADASTLPISSKNGSNTATKKKNSQNNNKNGAKYTQLKSNEVRMVKNNHSDQQLQPELTSGGSMVTHADNDLNEIPDEDLTLVINTTNL